MTLDMLKKGDTCTITGMTCGIDLRRRFRSIGIKVDRLVVMEEATLTKGNIKIKVNNSRIALRSCEAGKIEVKAHAKK